MAESLDKIQRDVKKMNDSRLLKTLKMILNAIICYLRECCNDTVIGELPVYESQNEAFISLGKDELFRFSVTNTDSVPSPESSVIGITTYNSDES